MNAYELNQMCSGIKVGDKVKVIATARAGDRGWSNAWPVQMDYCVGKVYTVREILRGRSGINTTAGWAFPYFVLEIVEES